MSHYQKAITKQCTKEILDQMEKSFCKIEGKDNQLGFFCYLNYQNKNITALLTKNDININLNNILNISLNDINTEIKLGDVIYENKIDKISIIEIEESKIDNIKYLEFDDKLYEKYPEILYHKELIYIIQYTNKDDILVSYSMINDINKNEFIYNCDINIKAKFSLIFNLSNNKLIGFHTNKYNNSNKGLLFKLKNDEIDLIIKIEQININKPVYFLDNGYYDSLENKDKFTHDNLKELNGLNTELYIDGIKEEYKKFFIPKEIREYNIKLIFKNYLIDCSYMFSGCENLIKIDLTNFNTKYVAKMNWMFYGCINVEYINLFNFKTENVNDMSFMFYQCKNLKHLDLSSFNTEKVTTMNNMFNECYNLTELNISSFDTNNVTNMRCMFQCCENIIDLDLSKFNTSNVTDMINMFNQCKNLKNINISSFDTNKITNMIGMFECCENIIDLDLSKLNTSNVTNMSYMFNQCKNLKNI